MYLKDSDSFISAGEGAYATRYIPKDIYYVIYGGRLYNKEEADILTKELKGKAESNRWMKDDPAAEAEWMYRYVNMNEIDSRNIANFISIKL